ncbi:MAG TPA: hypothetical protein VIP82_15880 [Microbacterium sp.]|uniref:hypothetical protein n=1 Tax=Microbacterium sp. TaxID=51671 RepID=UPI002F92C1FC
MSDIKPWRTLAVGLALAAATALAGASPASAAVPANDVFHLQEAEPPVTEVAVTVDSGAVTRDGAVTLQGTVTCDHAAIAYVEVTVMQRRGYRIAEATGSGLLECGPAPSPWVFELGSSNGVIFSPGNAAFNAFASAYGDGGGFANTSLIDQPVKLRPAR